MCVFRWQMEIKYYFIFVNAPYRAASGAELDRETKLKTRDTHTHTHTQTVQLCSIVACNLNSYNLHFCARGEWRETMALPV